MINVIQLQSLSAALTQIERQHTVVSTCLRQLNDLRKNKSIISKEGLSRAAVRYIDNDKQISNRFEAFPSVETLDVLPIPVTDTRAKAALEALATFDMNATNAVNAQLERYATDLKTTFDTFMSQVNSWEHTLKKYSELIATMTLSDETLMASVTAVPAQARCTMVRDCASVAITLPSVDFKNLTIEGVNEVRETLRTLIDEIKPYCGVSFDGEAVASNNSYIDQTFLPTEGSLKDKGYTANLFVTTIDGVHDLIDSIERFVEEKGEDFIAKFKSFLDNPGERSQEDLIQEDIKPEPATQDPDTSVTKDPKVVEATEDSDLQTVAANLACSTAAVLITLIQVTTAVSVEMISVGDAILTAASATGESPVTLTTVISQQAGNDDSNNPSKEGVIMTNTAAMRAAFEDELDIEAGASTTTVAAEPPAENAEGAPTPTTAEPVSTGIPVISPEPAPENEPAVPAPDTTTAGAAEPAAEPAPEPEPASDDEQDAELLRRFKAIG